MIKLYGLRMSNYYSLVKALMIEKGIEFEEVKTPPSQKEEFLVRSPMGKMPAIEVDGVQLSESIAIVRYLEQLRPDPALVPADPMQGAKVMELVCHLKLHVELVARRLLPEVLFKQPVSEETKTAVKADLAQGMAAVDRLFVAAPYAAGDTVTLADYPRIKEVFARMAQHPSVQRVEHEKAG